MSEVKYLEKRPHNKAAYNDYDQKAKNLVVNIMQELGYVLHGSVFDESYKKYDLNFKHKESNKFIAIENEVREKFDLIRDVWDTIHIPARKSETQMDRYFVWCRNLNEVIVIDRTTFLKSKENIVDIVCRGELVDGQKAVYIEPFINIPKKECKYYTVNKQFKLIEIVNPMLCGFLNYP